MRRHTPLSFWLQALRLVSLTLRFRVLFSPKQLALTRLLFSPFLSLTRLLHLRLLACMRACSLLPLEEHHLKVLLLVRSVCLFRLGPARFYVRIVETGNLARGFTSRSCQDRVGLRD